MEGTDESSTADNVVRAGATGGLPLLDERKSSQRSKHRSRMSRVFPFWKRRVKFSPTVTVYFQTIWSDQDYRRARVGPWIYLAADRHRFQRRIRNFESEFGYIFTDIHREYMYDLIYENDLNALIVDLNALNLND